MLVPVTPLPSISYENLIAKVMKDKTIATPQILSRLEDLPFRDFQADNQSKLRYYKSIQIEDFVIQIVKIETVSKPLVFTSYALAYVNPKTGQYEQVRYYGEAKDYINTLNNGIQGIYLAALEEKEHLQKSEQKSGT